MKRRTVLKIVRKRAVVAVEGFLAQVYAILVSPLVGWSASRERPADRLVESLIGIVQELDRDGRAGAVTQPRGRLSILALSPEDFRYDLEILAAHPELRILRLSRAWQRKLMHRFYGLWPTQVNVHNPRPGSGVARAQKSYRKFLRSFLTRFYARLGVDIVIGANVRYSQDVDWGAVSQQLGVPYVVFHRENLPVGPGRVLERMTNRYKLYGRFTGAGMAVHNSFAANLFCATNFITPDRIHELGCLRMDEFLRRIDRPRPQRSRPLILLFSFTSFSPSTFGKPGYFPPFRDCHGALASLAQRHPELDLVIRPKPGMSKSPRWQAELARAYEDWGLSPSQLPANISIDSVSPAHDLILDASVVVSLNSTTLIESAIAGLPVILPYFRYLREGPHAKDVLLRGYSDLFDVPDTGEDLIELVLHRLTDRSIPDEIMQRRRRLFAESVSPLDGKAFERYFDFLHRVVADQKRSQSELANSN